MVLLDGFKVLHVFFRFFLLFVESYSLHSTIRLEFDDFVLEKKRNYFYINHRALFTGL